MVFLSYNPWTFDWTNACDHKLIIVSSILVNISLRFWWFLLLRSLEFLHWILIFYQSSMFQENRYFLHVLTLSKKHAASDFFGEPYNISLKLLYSCVFVFAKTSEIHTFWRTVRLLCHTGHFARAIYMSKMASYLVGTCRIMLLRDATATDAE